MADTPTLAPDTEGTLYLIGGGENKEGRTAILDDVAKRVREAARCRPTCRMVIIPSAHKDRPVELASPYLRLFRERNLSEVKIAPLTDPESALVEATASLLSEAAGVFLTGGDQNHLAEILRDTPAGEALLDAYRNGAVVAGTSAGASAMSKHMLAGGEVHPPAKRGEIDMSSGLSLLPGIVVDQHFSQRQRIGRLVAVLVSKPDLLCLGIDENTAARIQPNGVMQITGEGSVTVFDGSDTGYCSRGEPGDGQPASVTDLKVHILVEGQKFDVERRRVTKCRPTAPR